MKVVLVSLGFPPFFIGGTEIATRNLAIHLSKIGHEVHVTTSSDESLQNIIIDNDVYVHRIICHNGWLIKYIFFWFKAFLEIKSLKPDIVHCQSITTGVVGILSQRFLGIPFVVYGRGSDVYVPTKRRNLVSKTVLKRATAVLALTDDMNKEMRKIFDRQIYTVPNGVVVHKFSRESGFGEVNPKKSRILFVGRLNKIKGLDYLIKAMRVVVNKYDNVELTIVGSGGEYSYLEALTKELDLCDKIIFVGEVPNEKISDYILKADIFVLPSVSEGFPNVILEAMSAGLAVVATNVGGIPSIIKNGANGFLVEPKNSEQLADKLLFLLQNPDLIESIGKLNRNKAKAYDWGIIANNLECIYLKAINNNKSSSI